MRELYRLLELAADSDATVLLQGESGTGKELAAEAIHLQGHRRNKPFVKVNCGALPETILESELFGHVKGAYTGAYRDRPGRFEAADGGTIFLDEIGEISQSVQVKLLRVLQHFEFERVGDDETRKVDVRVIAATNRDLAQRVMENEFREDFYYRLRVFPIKMPPLRERLDDLPLLIDHFINRFNEKTGKHITGLDEQALRAVSDYCWPGNIRELENAIEHAFVTCQTTLITLFDLPQELRRFELRREICDRNPNVQEQQTEQARMDIPKPARRQDNKRRDILHSAEALREVLDNCDWNKAETARTLGVSRTAVWQWMKRHGIPMNG
jgi:transcriptional regulator with GAF, ATPase, and Fis domain